MKLASNLNVLSVTPINDGKAVLLLIEDRNSGSQYLYTMPSAAGTQITSEIIKTGELP